MVTEVEADAGVYAAWQESVPDPLVARVQVLGLNTPPEPPSLHDTVPEGNVGIVVMSFTDAVKVIELPAVTDDGLGVTFVAVE
jgi:hypothetical protein